MSRRSSALRVGLTAAVALLLAAGPLSGWGQAVRGATADAPPNTERTRPDSPPSDVVIERLVEAAASMPSAPPSSHIELSDTVPQS